MHVANALTNYIEHLDRQGDSQYYDPYALFLGLRDRDITIEPELLDVEADAWALVNAVENLDTIIKDASDGFEGVLQALYPV